MRAPPPAPEWSSTGQQPASRRAASAQRAPRRQAVSLREPRLRVRRPSPAEPARHRTELDRSVRPRSAHSLPRRSAARRLCRCGGGGRSRCRSRFRRRCRSGAGKRLRLCLAARRALRLVVPEGRRDFDLCGGNAGRSNGEQNGGGGSRAEFHYVHCASFGVFTVIAGYSMPLDVAASRRRRPAPVRYFRPRLEKGRILKPLPLSGARGRCYLARHDRTLPDPQLLHHRPH